MNFHHLLHFFYFWLSFIVTLSSRLLTITSTGTADLVIVDIAFTDDTASAFSFVGSTRTPAVVPPLGANGLPGQLQLTVRVAVAGGAVPALGSSTEPVVIIGVATMKMTSSTSITSM